MKIQKLRCLLGGWHLGKSFKKCCKKSQYGQTNSNFQFQYPTGYSRGGKRTIRTWVLDIRWPNNSMWRSLMKTRSTKQSKVLHEKKLGKNNYRSLVSSLYYLYLIDVIWSMCRQLDKSNTSYEMQVIARKMKHKL